MFEESAGFRAGNTHTQTEEQAELPWDGFLHGEGENEAEPD